MPLRIRDEQAHALERVSAGQFRDRAVALGKKHWPRRDEASIARTVDRSIERAARYEIRSARCVLRYLNVMLALGDGFDEDPRYPWAPELLRDPGLTEHARTEQLAALAREELGG